MRFFKSLVLFLVSGMIVTYVYVAMKLIMKTFTEKEKSMLAIHTVQPYQYDQLVQLLYKKAYNMEKLADWRVYRGRTVIILNTAYHDVISVLPIEEIESETIYYYTEVDFNKI